MFQRNKNRQRCVADDGHQITFVLMDSRVFVSGVSLGAVLSGLSCFRPLPEKIYSFRASEFVPACLSTPIHCSVSFATHINCPFGFGKPAAFLCQIPSSLSSWCGLKRNPSNNSNSSMNGLMACIVEGSNASFEASNLSLMFL